MQTGAELAGSETTPTRPKLTRTKTAPTTAETVPELPPAGPAPTRTTPTVATPSVTTPTVAAPTGSAPSGPVAGAPSPVVIAKTGLPAVAIPGPEAAQQPGADTEQSARDVADNSQSGVGAIYKGSEGIAHQATNARVVPAVAGVIAAVAHAAVPP